MNENNIIRHRIDLLLSLINTATGIAVEGSVNLYRNGVCISYLAKDDGKYIFINSGREDFHLSIHARGYFNVEYDVFYEKLESNLPFIQIQLVPDSEYYVQGEYLTIEGTLEGLTSLVAVKKGESPCTIREFDCKKCIMTVFNTHHMQMNKLHYAVVNPDNESFEELLISEQITDEKYHLAKKLERPFENYFPVCRLVFGLVRENGSYLLRVPDMGSNADWMVRYSINESNFFQTVDFHLLLKNVLSLSNANTLVELTKG